MQKKYIVRLSKQERNTLREVVKKLKGSGQKVRRAQILLKADADGPDWTDSRIAEAFGCRRQTVETIRQRFVECGFQETLDRKKRPNPPTEKLLDGEQEAKIMVLAGDYVSQDWRYLEPVGRPIPTDRTSLACTRRRPSSWTRTRASSCTNDPRMRPVRRRA